MYLNLGVINLGVDAGYGRNSASANSSAEINRLLSELNSRLSAELDEIMSSVNTQIQRAINDAISSQILPEIQNALTSGSGHLTPNGWNVPAERPEIHPEEYRKERTGKKLKT